MMNNERYVCKAVRAEDLFGNASQVTIEHAGEAYVLSRTRQNKLLLTKPSSGATGQSAAVSGACQSRGDLHVE